jgi:hypothetical protein
MLLAWLFVYFAVASLTASSNFRENEWVMRAVRRYSTIVETNVQHPAASLGGNRIAERERYIYTYT